MDMKDKILKWFAEGETGASSKHMALTACGQKGEGYHPLDPSDLNRCIMLLEAIPEIREEFPRIAKTTKAWARVIEHWDELVELFHSEVGRNWCNARRAPNTYKRMRDILTLS